MLYDYLYLWYYIKCIYNLFGIVEIVNFDYIKKYYYGSYKIINFIGIILVGFNLDWII